MMMVIRPFYHYWTLSDDSLNWSECVMDSSAILDKMRSKGQGRYKTKCVEKDGGIHVGSLLSSIDTVSQIN